MKGTQTKPIAKMIFAAALPIVALVCIVSLSLGSVQSNNLVPLPLHLIGEYSENGGPWLPLEEGTAFDAKRGELILRGSFDVSLEGPFLLRFYQEHIGVSVSLNGELRHLGALIEMQEVGREDLLPSVCGNTWGEIYLPSISPQDVVEIRLCNIHNWGNRGAYNHFLNSFCITPLGGTVLEDDLAPHGMRYQLTGLVVVVISLMLLGASAAMALLKLPQGKTFRLMAATSLAGGIFAVVDTVNISFLSDLVSFNTTLWLISLMLFVYWLFATVAENIGGRQGAVAAKIVAAVGVMELAAIAAAMANRILLYDAVGYLRYVFFAVILLLSALTLWQLYRKEGSRLAHCAALTLMAAMLLDSLVFDKNFLTNLLCTKLCFSLFFLLYLLRGLQTLAANQRAAVRAKKLEAELEESRISIMLSQIQPHFLYNSLTAVIALCDRDPQRAKEAIADFADYLRGNLDSLGQKRLVPFAKELEHIRTYLRLEQMRFDHLQVDFDVQTAAFELPALTIQPLVENAVKHGVGKKIGGGWVKLSARETEGAFVVTVEDSGVGFAVGEPVEDGRVHVGLANVEKRLARMANASLQVESEVGVGTRATVTIPKR